MPATTRATRMRTIPTTTIVIMQLGMTLVRKRAVGKTCQALREGQTKLRQQMVELGGVAGVTAGGGTTSTATASGVAALQQGTGDNNNNCCNGSFVPDVFLFVFLCATISPCSHPPPGSSYCFFLLPVILIIWLLQQTNKQTTTTNNLHFFKNDVYDEIDTTTHKCTYTNTHHDIGLNVFVSWIVMACQVHNCHARLWISSKAQSTIDSVFVSPKTTS